MDVNRLPTEATSDGKGIKIGNQKQNIDNISTSVFGD